MKNFLFFPNSEQNWTLNFKDTENQIIAMKNYIQFFHPKFLLRDENKLIVEDSSNKKTLKYWELLPHNYVYVTEDIYIENILIPKGYIILSLARDEGRNTSIRTDLSYFLIQPLSTGAYYYNYLSNHQIDFIYIQETSNEQPFSFSFSNFRWIRKYSANSESAVVVTDINAITDIDAEEPELIQWNSRDILPMVFVFDDDTGEELITDTKLDYAANGVYINNGENKTLNWTAYLI